MSHTRNHRILEAIERRVSVRGYADRPVEEPTLEHLLAMARTLAAQDGHLTAVPPRIALISGAGQVRQALTFIVGSYGLVQNPPHLLVGLLPQDSDLARLDLGYVLEQVVLEATAVGLGSVWIAGSFDHRRAAELVSARAGETVAAVCALGYPAERGTRRVHDRVVRRLAGGHRRKSLTTLVFAERWGRPWSLHAADPRWIAVLEYARLAPSALNRQPWRFILRERALTLALVRPAPLDAGIVMAHVALAAQALGLRGAWGVRLGDSALAHELDLPQSVIPVGVFAPLDASATP